MKIYEDRYMDASQAEPQSASQRYNTLANQVRLFKDVLAKLNYIRREQIDAGPGAGNVLRVSP